MASREHSNPYSSPEETPSDERDTSEPDLRRPFGVSFIAGLMGLSAVGGIASFGWTAQTLRETEAFASVPIEYRWPLAWALVIAIVRFAAAAMLAGRIRAGWYVACFSLALSTLQYGWAVWHTSMPFDGVYTAQLAELRGQSIVRFLVAGAAFIYLQRSNVLAYFRVPQFHLPWLLAVIFLAAAAAMFGISMGDGQSVLR